MIGRHAEIEALRKAYASEQSEFVVLYGRRRVGKTFLVSEVFNGKFSFHHAGLENASKGEQLSSFREALKRYGHVKCPRLTTWISAFSELEAMLERLPEGKKTVFLDELPWYDTRKSGFLTAFESFWNGWASVRKDILLVVCGSATTWVINEVFRSRGGLHNRVTKRLPIAPFTLRECEEYAAYKHLGFNREQIAECYMALGGVAYYWSLLQEGQSAAQNFDRLFFGADDEMRGEYDRLFSSLFKSPTRHLKIVELLNGQKDGLSREDILSKFPKGAGGEISRSLDELCQCGFLRRYNLPGKVKKGAIYQLIDPYVLFYFEFLKNRKGTDPHYWTISYASPRMNAWRGRAFEKLCLWHVPQIKAALGIGGILTDEFCWRGESDEGERVQIDLILDRGDRMTDICEMKYSEAPYVLKEDEWRKIQTRIAVYRERTRTTKGVRVVMVAANGLKNNAYSGNVHAVVTLNSLF